jgi:uncharacterized membrane protein YccC
MVTTARTQTATVRQALPVLGLFSDLRIQYGIKLGLGGLLALYITQALRLQHANWAILSTLVMMNSQYVGAIGIKAGMRVVGTVLGSILGVWLIGTYSTTPTIFLPSVFLIIALATYKFGQFPASQTPYAYFLIGNSFVAVSTTALATPNLVWSVGINRTLETLVGVVAALLVNSLVWPRYARLDFFVNTRNALLVVGQLMSKQADAYVRHSAPPHEVELLKSAILQNLQTIRNLFQIGARESSYFRSHLGNYSSVINALSNVYQSTQDLERWTPAEVPLLDHVREEVESFVLVAAEEFETLGNANWREPVENTNRLDESFAALQAKIVVLRRTGIIVAAPLEAGISFLGHFAALKQIKEDLDQMRAGMGDLPQVGKKPPKKKTWHFAPTIDGIWLRAGIKGGTSVVIALVLMEWIHPPGSAAIPLSAWLLSFMGRTFLKSGDPGDQRSFLRVFQTIGILLAAFVILTLIMPLLANYAVMNIVLFILLFVFGFLTARVSGMTYWMNMAIIGFSVFVGLNPQVPVNPQTTIQSLLGLLLGVTIAAVVGRLFWPILPQRILKYDLLAFIEGLKELIAGSPHVEKIQSQLVVLPVDALQSAQVIAIPDGKTEVLAERRRIVEFVRSLQALAAHVRWLIKQRETLPQQVDSILRPKLKAMEDGYNQLLEFYANCFRKGECRVEFPTVDRQARELLDGVQAIRDSGILTNEPVEVPLRVLEVVNRYLLTSDGFRKCTESIKALQIHRYWGDWVL